MWWDVGCRGVQAVAYLEWSTRIALSNSAPGAPVIESAPFEPQPWDAPDAATRGRERYAAEQAAKADGGS